MSVQPWISQVDNSYSQATTERWPNPFPDVCRGKLLLPASSAHAEVSRLQGAEAVVSNESLFQRQTRSERPPDQQQSKKFAAANSCMRRSCEIRPTHSN